MAGQNTLYTPLGGMIMFEIQGINLLFNRQVIYQALDEIYEITYQTADDAIILYRSLGYAANKGYMEGPRELWSNIEDEEDFKLINRNILCIDKNGHEVWRIESPHLRSRRADSFLHVFKNKEDGRWLAISHKGHECDLDINTGKLSNIRRFAVK